MKIRSLMVSVHYPNKYHLWTPWNKYANLAISRLNEIEIEVIAPLPFSPPIRYLPYNEFSKIPLIEYSDEGTVHHPRFLYLLPKKIFYRFIGEFYRRSVSKYILNNIKKPDLIHAHQIYPDGYGVMELCKEWKIPLIVEVHSTGSLKTWLKDDKIKNKVFKVIQFSSRIFCISKELFEMLSELGIPREKIEIIPLGVDENKFKPQKKISRKDLDLNEEKLLLLLLFVGRLHKLKGIDILLKAVSQIKNDINNFRLVIIGKGSEKENLIDLSKKLNIEDYVTFTGELEEDMLVKWYSAADLFILPTTYPEGRPVVIYEAMASGCPIIATNLAGISEQIKEGYNGILIRPKNLDKLADVIKDLLKNDDLMKRMGENGRKRILEENWTWKGYADKNLEIYEKVINNEN